MKNFPTLTKLNLHTAALFRLKHHLHDKFIILTEMFKLFLYLAVKFKYSYQKNFVQLAPLASIKYVA